MDDGARGRNSFFNRQGASPCSSHAPSLRCRVVVILDRPYRAAGLAAGARTGCERPRRQGRGSPAATSPSSNPPPGNADDRRAAMATRAAWKVLMAVENSAVPMWAKVAVGFSIVLGASTALVVGREFSFVCTGEPAERADAAANHPPFACPPASARTRFLAADRGGAVQRQSRNLSSPGELTIIHPILTFRRSLLSPPNPRRATPPPPAPPSRSPLPARFPQAIRAPRR
jgi:hypothetical protein